MEPSNLKPQNKRHEQAKTSKVVAVAVDKEKQQQEVLCNYL